MAAGIGLAIGGALLKGIVGNGPALLTAIDGIVSKHVEDPNARAQITLEMQKLVNARDLALAQHASDLAQANLASATQLNTAGLPWWHWRNLIGYALAWGVIYCLAVWPFGTWFMTYVSAWNDTNYPPPPPVEWSQVISLLGVLLTGAAYDVVQRKTAAK